MTTTNRIEQLQSAHPWLLEGEATHLLVCVYAAYTNGFGYRGEQLTKAMDKTTGDMCRQDRPILEKLLKETKCRETVGLY